MIDFAPNQLVWLGRKVDVGLRRKRRSPGTE
jgi:hypothetical protein